MCPNPRVINLHITSYIQYPEPLGGVFKFDWFFNSQSGQLCRYEVEMLVERGAEKVVSFDILPQPPTAWQAAKRDGFFPLDGYRWSM